MTLTQFLFPHNYIRHLERRHAERTDLIQALMAERDLAVSQQRAVQLRLDMEQKMHVRTRNKLDELTSANPVIDAKRSKPRAAEETVRVTLEQKRRVEF